jgi:YVTN family beta-propeller protein
MSFHSPAISLSRRLAGAFLFLGLSVTSIAAEAEVLIVLNSRDANVSLIDPKTYALVGTVATGKEPHHLYPTPDGKSVLVANAASNDIAVLDPKTGQFKGRIKNIDDPYHLALSPNNKWMMIASNRLDHVDLYEYRDNPDGIPSLKRVKRWSAPKVKRQ